MAIVLCVSALATSPEGVARAAALDGSIELDPSTIDVGRTVRIEATFTVPVDFTRPAQGGVGVYIDLQYDERDTTHPLALRADAMTPNLHGCGAFEAFQQQLACTWTDPTLGSSATLMAFLDAAGPATSPVRVEISQVVRGEVTVIDSAILTFASSATSATTAPTTSSPTVASATTSAPTASSSTSTTSPTTSTTDRSTSTSVTRSARPSPPTTSTTAPRRAGSSLTGATSTAASAPATASSSTTPTPTPIPTAAAPDPAPPSGPPTTAGSLPVTGASGGALAGVALAGITAGCFLLVVARRRPDRAAELPPAQSLERS